VHSIVGWVGGVPGGVEGDIHQHKTKKREKVEVSKPTTKRNSDAPPGMISINRPGGG